MNSDRPLEKRYRDHWRFHPAADGSLFLSERSHSQLQELFPESFHIIRVFSQDTLPTRIIFPFEAILHSLPPPDVQNEIMTRCMAEEQAGRIPTPVYLGRTDEELKESFILDRPGGRRNYRWRLAQRPPKVPQARDRLKKLRRRMSDPSTRFVLSLGGGGLRLFAHAAVLKIIDLLEGREHIDELWGCSGGSIAALMFALGVSPDAMEHDGYDLYNERYDMILSPSKAQVLKNLAVEWLLPSNPFALKGFMDIQKVIQNAVTRLAKDRKVEKPLYCIAYNLHRKRNEVLTPLKVRKQDYGELIHSVSAIDAVLASSSIPILYVPRVIKKGKTSSIYVDGGTAEEVPLVSVYRKWKIDQKKQLTKQKKLFILAVNLFPQVSGWKIFRNKLIRRLPFVDILKWSSHVADLMRRARIEDHLQILRDDPQVEVWELVLPVKGIGVLDPKSIPRIIAGAHTHFMSQLVEIESGGKAPPK